MEGSVSSRSRDALAQPPTVSLALGGAGKATLPKNIPKGRTNFGDLPPELRNAIIEKVFLHRDVVNIELVDRCLSSRAHSYFAPAGAQLLRVSRLFNEIGKAVLPSNTVFGIHNQRVWGLQGSECGTSAHALVKHLDVNSRCWTNYTHHYFDWWPQVESINISQISTADLRHVYPNNSDALARMHHIPIFASQESALYMRMTGLDAEDLNHLTSRVSSILRLPGWSSEEAATSCRMTASVILQLEGASARGIQFKESTYMVVQTPPCPVLTLVWESDRAIAQDSRLYKKLSADVEERRELGRKDKTPSEIAAEIVASRDSQNAKQVLRKQFLGRLMVKYVQEQKDGFDTGVESGSDLETAWNG